MQNIQSTFINQSSLTYSRDYQAHAAASSVHPSTSAITAKASPIPFLANLPKSQLSDQSWHILHQQFVEYGRNSKEWTRKCILLLPEIEKQQIWRKKRFKDIYEYAAKLAGMSHYQVNEGIRTLKKTENLPEIRKVIEEKGINAVRPILTIVNQETAAFWAEKSRIMSQHTLETYVRGFRNLQSVSGLRAQADQSVASLPSALIHHSPSTEYLKSTISPKVTITIQLDPQIADQLQKLKGQSDWNETIGELLKLRQEKLDQNKPAIVEVVARQSTFTNKESGSEPLNKLEALRPIPNLIHNKNGHSRNIPTAIKKYVLAKTNCTCAFPGCMKSYEILHHTDRFALYHAHDPDHIVPLCKGHERLVHLGLIENENQSPQFWKIRTQPDCNDPKYEIDQIVEKFRQPTG